jgi:hypothetical protein
MIKILYSVTGTQQIILKQYSFFVGFNKHFLLQGKTTEFFLAK